MKSIPLDLLEKYSLVCGVDEAGRGPLAGPVYAAAVMLPQDADIPGLDDSKKLSEKKRELLYDEICSKAIAFSVSSVSETVIDDINILNATYQAMQLAIEGLDPVPGLALIDGNRSSGISFPNQTVVGGDGIYSCIAAASILAKVSRDRFMLQMAEQYPQYAFEKHKGYGTRLHYERLREFGPSPIHRKTFLRKMH